MGIVVRQSIITTIISYVGVVIGYVNLAYLYPKYLELNQVGLLRAIQDSALLLTPFASFGLAQSISRFYPRFSSNKKSLSQFIGLLTLLALMGFIVLVAIFLLFESKIIIFFSEKAPAVTQNIGLILWLTITLLYTGVYEQFARSQLKLAVPAFLREVGTRLLQALLVLLYFSGTITFQQFLFISVVIYVLMLVTLIVYLRIYSSDTITFQFNTIDRSQLKEIIIFSLVSFVGLSSVGIIAKIDTIMLAGMIGYESVAIYTTASYMATVIEVPKRAITQSAATLISNAFDRGDLKAVETIYSKTAINQMIIGSLLLLGVWANVQNIFAIMPKGELYGSGTWVILIVGSAKLFDMTFGPSSEVIGLSKYYWFNLIVISILAIATVAANIILIPKYGMNGAAFGTLMALTFYNAAKFVFILLKLKLSPFTINTLKVLLILIVMYFLNRLISQFSNVYVDVLIRSSVITIVYSSLILITRCSEDANKLFRSVISRLGINS